MPRRDQRMLMTLAVLSMVVAILQSRLGITPDVLLAVPALLLFLPLLAGRYVGEERLARLVARWRVRRPRPAGTFGSARRTPCVPPRGGRLIAAALAQRGPPALLAPR
jgi:hypothetical protein